MEIKGVEIKDNYAEAFGIKVSRLLVTAATKKLALTAVTEATGYATSVIGCPAEAGIDGYVSPLDTPDGRPGFTMMICNSGKKKLEHELLERIGMGILTAPTTAVFNALDNEDELLKVGFKLKFFGDGYEKELEIDGRKMHSIPIMSGDFLVESEFGIKDGVAGGNFFVMGDSRMSALIGAQVAVDAITNVPGTITPFPGGVVASGSKVGCNEYNFLNASTNEKMCVSLKEEVKETEIDTNVNGIYEIVIDGVDEVSVKKAMTEGIKAACSIDGVSAIDAGNFGGSLGTYKISLRDLDY
ncbi:MAG: formylmethanofuran--tetrahydromethanopterin N-formyltransferase [Methanobrevibacter sp.]|jgi:formylmethanofuran--tetrahydromethanopterin N-formyltransferase|nr:formylmethanofuran--tetrahydromethanopterin N-formyltransferase [Candidatus Methanovirga procula]